MAINISTIIGTIITGLLLAGILGWIRKPRLILYIPRLLSYSWLSEKGKLVELSIFNRGFKTEEGVEVILNKSLNYSLIGSNSQDAEISLNKLKIPRIGSSDDVTVLFLVEGGDFSPRDVVSCLSKETKGKTVEKYEELPVTWQQRVGGIVVFITLGAFLYGFVYFLERAYKDSPLKTSELNQIQKSSEKSTEQIKKSIEELQSTIAGIGKETEKSLNGWFVPDFYKTTSNDLYTAIEQKVISFEIQSTKRRGDNVTAEITIKNGSNKTLEASIEAKTVASIGKIEDHKLRKYNIIVQPNQKASESFSVIIPRNTANSEEKKIFTEVTLQDFKGKRISASTEFISTL